MQVSCAAEPEVIQAAFKALVKKYHPDSSNLPNANAKMVELNAAWEVISARTAQQDERKPHTRAEVRQEGDLDPKSIAALVAVAENPLGLRGNVNAFEIRESMRSQGFTALAVTLALSQLEEIGLVGAKELFDCNGEAYISYALTTEGLQWLLNNEHKLPLRETARPSDLDDHDPFADD